MRHPAKRTVIVASLLAAATLVGVERASSAEEARSSGPIVLVAKADKACFSASVHVNGTLVARTEAIVLPESEGSRIKEINAREGDRVRANQVLARLTPPPTPPGGGQGAGAQPGGGATAGAGRSQGATELRAPAAGLIVKSTAVVGTVASARAEPLFRIAVDGEIELMADVPSIYLPKLAAGQTARVELVDRDLTGRVRALPAEVNPVSQLGRVRISIENDPSLHVGAFARATIDAQRSCGVSVPRSAVLFRTEGTSVQVVRDGAVETRRVRVGLLADRTLEILDGVKEGETIVANAGTSLHDGDKVNPVLADEVGRTGVR
jgi:multidrug efflux pump subunit AcrA (membrane-fusion protein)